jgi:hypothetical protein
LSCGHSSTAFPGIDRVQVQVGDAYDCHQCFKEWVRDEMAKAEGGESSA